MNALQLPQTRANPPSSSMRTERLTLRYGEKLAFQDYGSYLRHDLSVSYKLELSNKSDLRLFGGVNNLFDNKGDFYPSGRGNYYSKYGGGKGRYAYIGVSYSF